MKNIKQNKKVGRMALGARIGLLTWPMGSTGRYFALGEIFGTVGPEAVIRASELSPPSDLG